MVKIWRKKKVTEIIWKKHKSTQVFMLILNMTFVWCQARFILMKYRRILVKNDIKVLNYHICCENFIKYYIFFSFDLCIKRCSFLRTFRIHSHFSGIHRKMVLWSQEYWKKLIYKTSMNFCILNLFNIKVLIK